LHIESEDFAPNHLRDKRGVEGLQKPELRATVRKEDWRKEDARFAQGQSWQSIVADFEAKNLNAQNEP
jgi:hypothetical protein